MTPWPGTSRVGLRIRSTPMPTKNLKGKTVTRENAYEVHRFSVWTWYVLKHYQAPEAEAKNPYARVFCLVFSPFAPDGEYGDVFLRDIPVAVRA